MENFGTLEPGKTDRELDNNLFGPLEKRTFTAHDSLLAVDLVCLSGLLHLVISWPEYL